MCPYLDIKYTIFIEECVQKNKNQSLMKIGPKALPTSGLIIEDLIDGLSKDTEYSFWIRIESLQSTTKRHTIMSERRSICKLLLLLLNCWKEGVNIACMHSLYKSIVSANSA